MTQKTRRVTQGRTARPNDSEANAVTVFGIRFSDSERIVLRDAAAKLGWTITKLVRMSAVERAAHILNTSQRTKIDFPGIADRLARVLCDRTPHEVCDASDPEAPSISFERFVESLGPSNEGYLTTPEAVSANDLPTLRTAYLLGGAEFLKLVLERCTALLDASTAPDRRSDPSPGFELQMRLR